MKIVHSGNAYQCYFLITQTAGRTMDSLVEFCSFQNGGEPTFLEVLAVPSSYENKETRRKLEANQRLKVVAAICIILTAIGITLLFMAILYHLTDKAIISIGDAFIFGIISVVFLWITAFLTLAMVYRPPKRTFEYRLLDLENIEEPAPPPALAAASPRCYG